MTPKVSLSEFFREGRMKTDRATYLRASALLNTLPHRGQSCTGSPRLPLFCRTFFIAEALPGANGTARGGGSRGGGVGVRE